MSVHGSIDHRIIGGGSGNGTRAPVNEAFTNIYNFMVGPYAQSIGISRIAYNTGSQGTGMGFWDTAQQSGENAWACFKFTSASIPFYVLLQYNNLDTSNGITGAAVGAGGGSPGTIFAGGFTSGIGVQFALDDNGGNVWNGTTASLGRDTKGAVVWQSGSVTGSLFVFPRSNSVGGTHATLRQNMFGMVYNLSNNAASIKYSGARMHLLVDQNNFLFIHDIGYDGSYQMCWFGKYDQRPDITSSMPPYCMIGYNNSAGNPMPGYDTTVYGTTTGNDTTQEGGIVFPLTASDGAPNGQMGVKACSIDLVPNFLFDGRFHPNGAFLPSKYDAYPAFLFLNESPLFGFLGRINFFSMCFNLPSHATDVGKNRAVFGANAQNTAKMVVPWDGVTSPGQTADRLGHQF